MTLGLTAEKKFGFRVSRLGIRGAVVSIQGGLTETTVHGFESRPARLKLGNLGGGALPNVLRLIDRAKEQQHQESDQAG